MQKAYRSLHSMYSLCCSVLREGTPGPAGRGDTPVLPGWGTPPRKNPRVGYPTPSRCGQTYTCENSTFPILRMWAVISLRYVLGKSWGRLLIWLGGEEWRRWQGGAPSTYLPGQGKGWIPLPLNRMQTLPSVVL